MPLFINSNGKVQKFSSSVAAMAKFIQDFISVSTKRLIEDANLSKATGETLDQLGKLYGVDRGCDESDSIFEDRIRRQTL